MSQSRVPFSVRWICGLVCTLLVSISPLRAVEQFTSLASLPRDSTPASTLLQGQDGFLYGVLEYTDINHENGTNGLVYRLSTKGGFSVMYRFPWDPANSGEPNATGSEPSHLLAMGRDGFLYGIAKEGGAYGCGVLYRLSPNREYSVLAHLTPLLAGYNLRGFVLGPDQAVYTTTSDDGLIRIGFDGTVQVVAGEYTDDVSIRPYNDEGSELLVTWSTGRRILHSIPGFRGSTSVTIVKPVLHMRVLELPSLNVKESQVIDFFPEQEYQAHIIAVRQNEILAVSPPPDSATPGRLVSFDRAGNATHIVEIGGTSTNGPFIPSMTQTLVAADGTIFFTTGEQTRFDIDLYGFGGTEIFWLKRNGQFKKIGDLKGYPLAAWCEGQKGNNLYGVSWGPVVLETEDSESASAVSARNAVRLQIPAPATHTLAKASTGSPRVRRAAFRYQSDPTTGNFLPLAKPDHYTLPAGRNVTSLKLPVLRNDRDVEKNSLDIIEVGNPSHGAATIVPSGSGKAPVITYTPNAGPGLSDTFTYTIRDAQGGTAVGQISVRGVLNGKFLGTDLGRSGEGTAQAVSLDKLNIKVAASGRLTGAVKVNGRNLTLSGKFRSDNAAHLHRRIKGTEDIVFADLTLINVNDTRHLRYKITYLGQVFEGTLPAL